VLSVLVMTPGFEDDKIRRKHAEEVKGQLSGPFDCCAFATRGWRWFQTMLRTPRRDVWRDDFDSEENAGEARMRT